MERSTSAESLTRRLGKDCNDQERRAQAIAADDLLTALKNGQSLDLEGVVIEGDLFLDQLPLTHVVLDEWPSRIQDTIRDRQWDKLRQIPGAMSIRHSAVRGGVGTRLKDGALLVKGPVTMTGTIFERPVDFSRTVFAGPVDFSDAIFVR
ncbi:MAG TPA: pentapeptide repeat-containing protein, partial [Nitrospiraceae bacterium]|nr:pentapeptide repeat-containing protein [Nitrospiraceae bacterium]